MSNFARVATAAVGAVAGAAVGFVAQSFLTDHGDDRFVSFPDAWWGVGIGASTGAMLLSCLYCRCFERDPYEGIYTGPYQQPNQSNRERLLSESSGPFAVLPPDDVLEQIQRAEFLAQMEEGRGRIQG